MRVGLIPSNAWIPRLRRAADLASEIGRTPRDDTLPRALTMNPLVYFEIPVADMSRARMFYERVFAVSLELREIDGNEMALFPHTDVAAGRSLAQRER